MRPRTPGGGRSEEEEEEEEEEEGHESCRKRQLKNLRDK